MTAAELKNPACFKIRDTDSFLCRHGSLWIGVGLAALGSDEAQVLFERGDAAVEEQARNRGFTGHWVTLEEAHAIEARDQQMLACKPGEYPWDDWQREALAAGIAYELANLGRAVMREANQHGWCDHLKYECGAGHDGSAKGMIAEAKASPQWCRLRWEWLLVTDGLRCEPWDRSEMSPRDLGWNELQHRWLNEFHPIEDANSDDAFLRSAYREIEDAYGLDQLAIISLSNPAFHRGGEVAAFYAEYVVIETELGDSFHPHIPHQGIVQVRFDPKLSEHFDVDVFERRDECAKLL